MPPGRTQRRFKSEPAQKNRLTESQTLQLFLRATEEYRYWARVRKFAALELWLWWRLRQHRVLRLQQNDEGKLALDREQQWTRTPHPAQLLPFAHVWDDGCQWRLGWRRLGAWQISEYYRISHYVIASKFAQIHPKQQPQFRYANSKQEAAKWRADNLTGT